jgi:hypothetical protein
MGSIASDRCLSHDGVQSSKVQRQIEVPATIFTVLTRKPPLHIEHRGSGHISYGAKHSNKRFCFLHGGIERSGIRVRLDHAAIGRNPSFKETGHDHRPRSIYDTRTHEPGESQGSIFEHRPKVPGGARVNSQYYLLSEDGGTAGGVYLWQSREDAEKLYTKEWKDFIHEKYGAEPSIVYFHSPVVVDNLTKEIIKD